MPPLDEACASTRVFFLVTVALPLSKARSDRATGTPKAAAPGGCAAGRRA